MSCDLGLREGKKSMKTEIVLHKSRKWSKFAYYWLKELLNDQSLLHLPNKHTTTSKNVHLQHDPFSRSRWKYRKRNA
jgi:hypothetical protein